MPANELLRAPLSGSRIKTRFTQDGATRPIQRGTWMIDGDQLKLKWLMSEESWTLPLALRGQGGEVTPNVGPKYDITAKRL